MGSPGKEPHTQGSIILFFGPEIPSFSNQSLLELKSALKSREWATGVLSVLLPTWDLISTKIPFLNQIPGKQQLGDLETWLREGPPEQPIGDLPNVVLAPLTVLTQFAQFQQYSERENDSERDPHKAPPQIIPLGFCMGLLSAFAIAHCKDTTSWNYYVAVAVRLAIIIGAVVDATDVSFYMGAFQSMAVSWQDSEQERRLQSVIDESRGCAYISVRSDERRSTVTVSKYYAPKMMEELRKAGISAVSTGLRGQFHSEYHGELINDILRLCDSKPAWFQFMEHTCVEARHTIQPKNLHRTIIEAILLNECNWYETVLALVNNHTGSGGRLSSVSFGQGRFIPLSLQSKFDNRFEQLMPQDEAVASRNDEVPPTQNISHMHDSHSTRRKDIDESDDIAIVGMSIKVAGADDLPEFSAILRAGKSQHQEVPAERVPFGQSPWRRPEVSDGRKWYGNFMRDIDAFDHRFFRKSPRESAAMDPQQRLVLQAAYQAVEQSGYFNPATSASRDKHIGVYLGTCATEYEHNAACYAPGAFTVMGLLRGSIAGRISHYFGWTGPSMTFDTACSGSAVAIHSAVQALRSGECSAALCGGVNVITNEVWFHNLAGASFLSPTGQCKPFDEAADGYCRGEGIGCVLLKPVAAAIADGDQIFGRIARFVIYPCLPLSSEDLLLTCL
ncbi:beta-ketoacyl synthase [Rostrohypoxylon terebratum]|nr:beta-ketoacyl synthase [Rostrohypoxylon terebratum]